MNPSEWENRINGLVWLLNRTATGGYASRIYTPQPLPKRPADEPLVWPDVAAYLEQWFRQ